MPNFAQVEKKMDYSKGVKTSEKIIYGAKRLALRSVPKGMLYSF
jgi:hypothetical protein